VIRQPAPNSKFLDKLQAVLEEFLPARSVSLDGDEGAIARNFFLLT